MLTVGSELIERPNLAGRQFRGAEGHADICALAVTFKSAAYIGALVESLRRQLADLNIRLIVADNVTTDDTNGSDRRATGCDWRIGLPCGFSLAEIAVGTE
jgi:hypothetical protein